MASDRLKWRRTILIVEDNPVTLKALDLAVRTAGYNTLCVTDGTSALTLLSTVTADLACLDLVLPDMDGIELARRIRELPNGMNMKLIAVSGLRSKLEKALSLSRGFSDLIFKPIEPSKLVQRLSRLLPIRPV